MIYKWVATVAAYLQMEQIGKSGATEFSLLTKLAVL